MFGIVVFVFGILVVTVDVNCIILGVVPVIFMLGKCVAFGDNPVFCDNA